jgi:hypothetical protein
MRRIVSIFNSCRTRSRGCARLSNVTRTIKRSLGTQSSKKITETIDFQWRLGARVHCRTTGATGVIQGRIDSIDGKNRYVLVPLPKIDGNKWTEHFHAIIPGTHLERKEVQDELEVLANTEPSKCPYEQKTANDLDIGSDKNDATQQRLTERIAELQKENEELKAKNKELTDFVALVGQEFQEVAVMYSGHFSQAPKYPSCESASSKNEK